MQSGGSGRWVANSGRIEISQRRLPIVDVVFRGDTIDVGEYEATFQQYARIAERGEAVLWLIDMRDFSPLRIDAAVRKQASEVFLRYQTRLLPVSVAEARITSNSLTRYVLTAFDWLTGANKWPCRQFTSETEALAWLGGELARAPRRR